MLPAAPSPLSSGGGGNPSPRVEGLAGRSTGSAAIQHHPPLKDRLHLPWGSRQSGQAGAQLAHHHPDLNAYPSAKLDGRLDRDVETQQQRLTPPASSSHSFAAPSWASLVRGGERLRDPQPQLLSTSSAAVSREDLLSLYERCIESGLKAHFTIRHATGL
jgi:hypothetical protein